ncbi:polysaccharide biosynthesis/export family protein [Aquimarina sp. MMG016]|uniref:polysaccharide biosynthesis/export family protein n=1 Tax=Aquimarina sp. MMG016 TaxID=2822690 RepID=UPI001B39DD5D|nr:polysaccharide biosynthesis/export family protein [Aquimarina sp. MMG016]MBQ4819540.1 polysaccharide export protein [Aquimarina sp. MMG016]
MQPYKFLFVLLISISIFSCKTPTDVVYFQNSNNLEKIPAKNSFTPVFKVDDVLSILVSASDMDAARPFNLQGTSLPIAGDTATGAAPGNGAGEPTYLIDEDGNIDFPVLGKLKVSGLTRVQVKALIKEKLEIYIKDPIVNVRLKNFKITVIGEVNRPGSFTIPNERITIIEAIGLAGDLTITGKRGNIMVIRENEGVNTYHRVDLTSKSIFDSPAYYLAQNDVLYVEPNTAKVRSSEGNRNTVALVLSIITVVLSVVTLIVR